MANALMEALSSGAQNELANKLRSRGFKYRDAKEAGIPSKNELLDIASKVADFLPVIGGVKGAYEEGKTGNYLMSALNAATVPLDVVSGGIGGALLKGSLLGMVKRGKDYDKIPSMLKEIEQTYKETGDVKKLRKIEAAILDQDEITAFNANRHPSQPKLATGSLDYNGKHHYQSRADTPDGNGYAIDDLQAQLDSVTTGKLVPQVDRAGVAMKQSVKRDDGYGNTLTDKMSIMVSPDGKGELYSVIPNDGLKKGQKVRSSLFDSGDQAHPISDGVRIESGEPLNINIAPSSKLTKYELAHLTAQKNAALPIEQGGLGLPLDNTAIDRANHPLMFPNDTYHGTNKEFEQFDMSKANPRSQYMPGVFSADNPNLSETFGDIIMPLRQANGVTIADKVKARREGLPIPEVDTIHDKNAGVWVTNNPANIRSRFAAFDPMRRHEADLLGNINPALLGAMGLGSVGAATAATQLPDEYKNNLRSLFGY